MDILPITPFASSLDTAFWSKLTELKINVLKLDDSVIPLSGQYSAGRTLRDKATGQEIQLGCHASFTGATLGGEDSLEGAPIRGTLKNFNTIEDFKRADKQALFDEVTEKLWAKFQSQDNVTAVELNPAMCITFADLKKYKYYYWFCFPAFVAQPAWQMQEQFFPINAIFTNIQIHALSAAYPSYAAATREDAACCLVILDQHGKGEFAPISQWKTLVDANPGRKPDLLFLDPSAVPNSAGWPVRNMLTFLGIRFGVTSIRLICWRDEKPAQNHSLWKSRVVTATRTVDGQQTSSKWSAVGWEKNAAGKLSPRLADLGPMLDPKRLADQAVDLNLKLMRWRIMPSLDLDKIKETKCLLLGAGTLGCYVARTLMAWGVRHITLIDSSTVSFSNPVRQPLFQFEDCLEGGKPKAQCAAEALLRIYPGVNATGLSLSIPMPGHPIPESSIEHTKQSVATLEKLIDEHDVVYLLMDSRESRWLPTMLGAQKKKLVINAALGFDTYLVMRHGVRSSENATQLGCYYCSDITAARDAYATLDQMCTVTRPGLAAIASATAVELMVSVLQHPLGSSAPSDVPLGNTSKEQVPTPTEQPSSPLGIVPHQIRGFLAQFRNMPLTGHAYDRCTGCSRMITEAYEKDGFEMLLAAFNDATTLEKVTGLDKLAAEMDASLANADWEEEGGDEDF